MSDTGKFKSSQEAAQKNSTAISGAAAVGGAPKSTVKIIKTNLSVVGNIREMETQLSSCNTEFKQLVADDADSIMNLSEFFINFDGDIAGNMGVKGIERKTFEPENRQTSGYVNSKNKSLNR